MNEKKHIQYCNIGIEQVISLLTGNDQFLHTQGNPSRYHCPPAPPETILTSPLLSMIMFGAMPESGRINGLGRFSSEDVNLCSLNQG